MRLFALPLTKAIPGKHESLVYYLAHLPPKPKTRAETRTGRLVKLATNQATETWSRWSKAPESSWKFKVYSLGMKAQRQLDFEELALKSIDPALGPRITSSGEGAGVVKAVRDGKPVSVRIPIIHPPSFRSLTSEPPLANLRKYASHRVPKHKKLFYTYIFAAPFTAPFMLIPVIPNIPFFFCVWRAWSNYRAYKAADYLLTLLSSNTLVPTASETLESIYRHTPYKVTPHPPQSSADRDSNPSRLSQATSPSISVLLREDEVPQILDAFGLPKESGPDLLRAIKQARMRIHT
ncbi:mitochondrial K+-H+ exchange-related-domain-containing protein [Cantharellus anzutake]|uniref:mitochondrial K+-H+ exchange-related-domain-containing protein n=1 Tax=Cantharellus anzutake TaxID=1750568 RepID=UPI0019032B0F|nr:mitochondrial K+-H+ exchange-related-domain-containing protein [Cantharellus anzutake]KAF8339597.1 mitochondrial K+-H+ exchange-related-domain-containing protein [Cantharellus anzutake]